MVDNNVAEQSSRGGVSNPVLPVVSGGRKKIWIVVGVSTLVIVLLVLGGFFMISSLDKEDIPAGNGGAGSQTNIPRTTPIDDTTPADDTTPIDDTTPADDTTPTDSGDVASLQDLLDGEEDQAGDDGPGVELGMTITSLTCSDTSFDIEVTVGALPIEGVIFYFKDGVLNLPYSELSSIPPGGVETFSFDVTGRGLDVANSFVEVKAFTLDGESGILDSKSC